MTYFEKEIKHLHTLVESYRNDFFGFYITQKEYNDLVDPLLVRIVRIEIKLKKLLSSESK